SLLLVRQDGSGSLTRLLAGQSLARVVVYQRTVVIVGMCVCRLVQLLGDLITLGSGRQYEVVLAVLVHEPLGQLAVGQVPVADQFVGQCTTHTLHIERGTGVLQHREVALLENVCQVTLVRGGRRVGALPTLVTGTSRELGQRVHLPGVPLLLERRVLRQGKRVREPGVCDQINLHLLPP